MLDDEFDVWPEDLTPSIQSPLAVLKQCVSNLGMRTNGVLQGNIFQRIHPNSGDVSHVFRIIVPVLGGYSQEILKVIHSVNIYYPCTVYGMSSEIDSRETEGQIVIRRRPYLASTDVELRTAIRNTIRSPDITSVLFSLVAKANETIDSVEKSYSNKNSVDDIEPDKSEGAASN